MHNGTHLEQPDTQRVADEPRGARYEKLFFGGSANLK